MESSPLRKEVNNMESYFLVINMIPYSTIKNNLPQVKLGEMEGRGEGANMWYWWSIQNKTLAYAVDFLSINIWLPQCNFCVYLCFKGILFFQSLINLLSNHLWSPTALMPFTYFSHTYFCTSSSTVPTGDRFEMCLSNLCNVCWICIFEWKHLHCVTKLNWSKLVLLNVLKWLSLKMFKYHVVNIQFMSTFKNGVLLFKKIY